MNDREAMTEYYAHMSYSDLLLRLNLAPDGEVRDRLLAEIKTRRHLGDVYDAMGAERKERQSARAVLEVDDLMRSRRTSP